MKEEVEVEAFIVAKEKVVIEEEEIDVEREKERDSLGRVVLKRVPYLLCFGNDAIELIYMILAGERKSRKLECMGCFSFICCSDSTEPNSELKRATYEPIPHCCTLVLSHQLVGSKERYSLSLVTVARERDQLSDTTRFPRNGRYCETNCREEWDGVQPQSSTTDSTSLEGNI